MRGSDHNMMAPKRYLRRVLVTLLLILMTGALTCEGAPTKWEPVKSERQDVVSVAKDNDTEIRSARGVIIVVANKPVQIKIYTILGQLVSRENLPAGTHQLALQAHGVYIIKTPDLTCKVAL